MYDKINNNFWFKNYILDQFYCNYCCIIVAKLTCISQKKKWVKINKSIKNNDKSILKTQSWRKICKEQSVLLWWFLVKFLMIKNELEEKMLLFLT